MLFTWWRKWFNRTSRRAQRGRTAARLRRPWLSLELLEDRLTPATHTWLGLNSGLWSDPTNWIGGAPAVGESKVVLNFGPQSPIRLTTDDIPGNLVIDQINFTSGYELAGKGSSSITLNGGAASPTVSDTSQGYNGNLFDASLPVALGGSSNSTFQFTSATDVVNSTLTGTEGLTLSGAGTLALGAKNSYGGNTDIQGGTLALASDNALPTGTTVTFGSATTNGTLDLNGHAQTVAGLAVDPSVPAANQARQVIGSSSPFADSTLTFQGGTSTFAGTIQDTLPGGTKKVSLTVTGGTLTLSGTSNTYSGGTAVLGGTLADGAANALPAGTALTVGSGAKFDLGGNNQALAGLTLNGGTVTTGKATLTLNGDVTATGTSSITGTDPGQGKDNVDLPADRKFTVGTANPSTDTLTVDAVIGGKGGLDKEGPGTLDLIGSNTYSGGTTVGGGTLQVGSEAALGAAGAGVTINAGTLEATGTFATTQPISLGDKASAIKVDANQTLTLQGGVGDGTAAGTLNATGAGILVLAPQNMAQDDYSGGTAIRSGTLQLGADGALPAGTTVTFGSATGNGILDLNGHAQKVAGLAVDPSVLAANQALQVIGSSSNEADSALTFAGGSTTSAFGGTIQDTLPGGTKKVSVTVTSGTLNLTGSNTYSGATAVNGVLLVNGSLTSDVTVNAGGTLGGNGTITGDVSVKPLGTITAGTLGSTGSPTAKDVGHLTVNGNLAIAGTFQADLVGSAADQITVNGASSKIDLTGGTLVANASSLDDGAKFTLIDNNGSGSITSTLANAPEDSAVNVGGRTVFYSYRGGKGGDFTLHAKGKINHVQPPPGGGGGAGPFNYTVTRQKGTNNIALELDGVPLDGGFQPADSVTDFEVHVSTDVTGAALPSTLTVDFTNGNPIPAGGVLYDAQGSAASSAGGAVLKLAGGSSKLALTHDLSVVGNDSITLGSDTAPDIVAQNVTAEDGTQLQAANLKFVLPSSPTITLLGTAAATSGLTVAGANTVPLGFANPASSLEFDAKGSGGTAAVALGSGLTLPSSLRVAGGVTFDLKGDNVSAAGLTGAGTVTNSGTSAPATLTVTGGASQFDGVIQDGSSTTALAVTGGSLKLTNTNTYSGGTTVSTDGKVQVGADANLGAANGTVTINRGTLEATAGFSTARAIAVTDAASTLAVDAGTLAVQTAITGGGSLHKVGPGTLDLSGLVNKYGGSGQATAIDGGTLVVSDDNGLGDPANTLSLTGSTLQATGPFSSARTVTLNAGGGTFDTHGNQITLNGTVGGAGGLTKAGAGTLALTGADTYGVGTTINQGTVQVGGDGNLGMTGTGVTINAGTLEATGGFATARAFTLGDAASAIQVDGGSLQLTKASAVGGNGALHKAGAGTLDLTQTGANGYSGGTFVDGGTLKVSADGNLGAAGTGVAVNAATLEATAGFPTARAITLGAGADTLMVDAGTLAVQTAITGGGSLHKAGPGVLDLSGLHNTYGGSGQTTAIDAGTLVVNGDDGLGDVSNSLSLTGSTLQATGSFGSARTVTLNAGGGTFDTHGNNVKVTLGGAVGGPGSLTKAGAGTLALTSVQNNYGGGTTINAGVVQVSDDRNLGAPGTGVAIGAAALEASENIITGRTITLSNAASAITVDVGKTLTVGAPITGGGSLHKAGSGTLDLSNLMNSYGGSGQMTAIDGGTLRVSSDAGLGALVNTLSFTANGSTLQASGTIASSRSIIVKAPGAIDTGGFSVTLSGPVNSPNGKGSLGVRGSGTLQLDGSVQVPLDYQSGTTLRGHGSVQAVTLEQGATFIPGSALQVNGDLTLKPGSTFLAEIKGTSTYSQAVVTGSITLGGANLQLSFGPDFNPNQAADQPLTLIVNQGKSAPSGTFAGLPDDVLVSHSFPNAKTPNLFELSYVSGGRPDSVALTALSQSNLYTRALFVDFSGQGAAAGSTPADLAGINNLLPGVSGLSWSDLRQPFLATGNAPEQETLMVLTSPLRRVAQAEQVISAYANLVQQGVLRHAPSAPAPGSAEYLALVSNFVRSLTTGILVHHHLRVESPGQAFTDLLLALFRQGGRKHSNRGFVSAVYLLLGLPAQGDQTAGQHTLNGWVDLLNSKRLTPSQVATGILGSPEVGQLAIQDVVGLAQHDTPGSLAGLSSKGKQQVQDLEQALAQATTGNGVFVNNPDVFEAQILSQDISDYVTAFVNNPAVASQIVSR